MAFWLDQLGFPSFFPLLLPLVRASTKPVGSKFQRNGIGKVTFKDLSSALILSGNMYLLFPKFPLPYKELAFVHSDHVVLITGSTY